ncbi:MAG: CpaF family protein [Lachnospiraceae bacterium]|nr:CpaF family protein [Lachnospiraceae bacterium]
MEELDEYRKCVIEKTDLSREISEDDLYGIIDDVILEKGRSVYVPIEEKIILRKKIYDSIKGFDVLQDIIEDDDVTEIMINGPDNIFIEREGKITRYNGSFSSGDRMVDIIRQIVSKVNRRVNEASPIVDTRLSDGSRVNVVLNPVALDGPAVTIRKFPKEVISMERLIELKSLDKDVAEWLRMLVISGYNIFISGGTGSGKTTFLNALSGFIPKDERIITIEDSAELQIKGIDNMVRLEVRQENDEGENGVTIRELIRAALRMRPSRIIVGEVRGEEALDMLQAMNTGHDGSLSTGHANGTKDMLTRLETMVLMGVDMPVSAIRGQIAAGIDIIIHLGRLRDKSRRVLEIVEILGYEGGEILINPLYRFIETGESDGRIEGCLERSKNEMQNIQKLKSAGFTDGLFSI